MPKNAGIKAFVEAQLRAGKSREISWRIAQGAFPHKKVNWSYVIWIDNHRRDNDRLNTLSE